MSCNQIDDFLLGLLDQKSADDFERHLASCSHCREEIELQRRAESVLLEIPAAIPTPRRLLDSVESLTDVSSATTLENGLSLPHWIGPVSVAAAALLALLIWINRESTERRPTTDRSHVGSTMNSPSDPANNQEQVPQTDESPDSHVVQVSFPQNQLARPIESQQPGVTIFWVYPQANRPQN